MATTQTKVVDESQALVKILNEAMPELKRLAPKYLNLSRLMALALEAKMKNELLAKCSIASVVAFCKQCAEWGTDRVGAGGVWAVPFWNKTTASYDMKAIPDWRLLVEKAKKAKAITHARPDVVREGDTFKEISGMRPDLIHEPLKEKTGAVIAAYCVYTLPDGTRDFVVMSATELEKVRKSSKAKDDGPWISWPEEMMKKTVVKRTMKLFEGASVELTALLEADNAVFGIDLTPQEPITMPKAIGVPEKEEATSTSETPAEPKMVIPEGWIVGKDKNKKSIPHPHAGRPLTEVPDADLTAIMEGLRADPKVSGKAKEEKYQSLLTAIEDDLKARSETAKKETVSDTPDKAVEQPQSSTGTPLDQALAKITSIVTASALLKFWADYEKDITTWTGAEQSRFKMAFDSRMTEIKDLAKSGKLL
jgi:recombination protein RecT